MASAPCSPRSPRDEDCGGGGGGPAGGGGGGAGSGGGSEEEGDRTTGLPADIRDVTLKDILSRVQGGKKSGAPMPSTVKRRLERLKRRRDERARQRCAAAAPEDASAPASSTSAVAAPATRGDGQEEDGDGDDRGSGGGRERAGAGARMDGEGDEGGAAAAATAAANGGRPSKRAAVAAAVLQAATAAAAAAASGSAVSAAAAGAGLAAVEPTHRPPENADDATDGSGSETHEQHQAQPTVVAPKVTIDDDGNIVIDKESLVVSAAPDPAADLDNVRLVTVDNNAITKHITSATFARRDAAQKWEEEDDEKFFQALSRFGTDFSLIEHVFPKRSRRQIKLKFKREERKNRAKVDACLRTRASISITETRKQFGLTGEAPVPLSASVTSPAGTNSGPIERTTADAAVAVAEQTRVTPPLDPESNGAGPGEGSTMGSPPIQTPARSMDCSSDDDDDDDDDEDDREHGAVAGTTITDTGAGGMSGSFGLAAGLGDRRPDRRHESDAGLPGAALVHQQVFVADDGDDMDDVLAHQQY